MVTLQEVIALAEKLPPQDQTALLAHLLRISNQRELTVEEKKALLQASVLDIPLGENFSLRREDWYGDDGR